MRCGEVRELQKRGLTRVKVKKMIWLPTKTEDAVMSYLEMTLKVGKDER